MLFGSKWLSYSETHRDMEFEIISLSSGGQCEDPFALSIKIESTRKGLAWAEPVRPEKESERGRIPSDSGGAGARVLAWASP